MRNFLVLYLQGVRSQLEPIEASRIVAKSGIAPGADVCDDSRDSLADLCCFVARAGEQFGEFTLKVRIGGA
jgi:hypothetical protein